MRHLISAIFFSIILSSVIFSLNSNAALYYGRMQGESQESGTQTRRENNRISSYSELEDSIQNKNFLEQFEKFKTTFNSRNVSELNGYVNPEFGLFVLDNPGASVIGYYFKSFDSIFNSTHETNLYRMKKIELYCEPIMGKLPEYNCDGGESEGWNKRGCYYNNENESIVSFGIYGFTDENGNSGFDDDGNYNEKHSILQTKFNKNAGQVENVFYSTDSVIGLYFGEISGELYLLMIDLVTPCDA